MWFRAASLSENHAAKPALLFECKITAKKQSAEYPLIGILPTISMVYDPSFPISMVDEYHQYGIAYTRQTPYLCIKFQIHLSPEGQTPVIMKACSDERLLKNKHGFTN